MKIAKLIVYTAPGIILANCATVRKCTRERWVFMLCFANESGAIIKRNINPFLPGQ